MTGGPTPEIIRAAVGLAVRAPSVHNTQPWHFRFGHGGLHLYADPARHLTATDPDGRRTLEISRSFTRCWAVGPSSSLHSASSLPHSSTPPPTAPARSAAVLGEHGDFGVFLRLKVGERDSSEVAQSQ